MEAMLGRPISEIVSEIALPGVVCTALLGRRNRYRETLDLVKAFEAGTWGEISELAGAALGPTNKTDVRRAEQLKPACRGNQARE